MKKTFLTLMAALAVVGCVKNEFEEPKSPVSGLGFVPQDVVATLDEGDTKTSINSDGSVLWSEGDKISVLYSGNNLALSYILKEGVGSTSGKFTYAGDWFDTTVPGTSGKYEHYYGVYPAYALDLNKPVLLDGGKLQVNIPAEQRYTKIVDQVSFDRDAAVMTGASDNINAIQFKNATGLLKIFLYMVDEEGNPYARDEVPPVNNVESITISSNGHLLAGPACIESSAAVIKEGGVKSATLSSATPVNLSPDESYTKKDNTVLYGKGFIFALPPTAFEANDLSITIKMVDAGGTRSTLVKTVPSAFKVTRSAISTLAIGYKQSDIDTGIEHGVAKIGTSYYDTLEDAIAAATEGQTITLLKDITVNDAAAAAALQDGVGAIRIGYPSAKKLTLDGDGHSITAANFTSGYKTHLLSIENGSEVTLNNLTLNASTIARAAVNTYAATATLENVVTNDGVCALNVNLSTVTVKGENTDLKNGTWYAVNVANGGEGAASLTVESGKLGAIVCDNTKGTCAIAISGGNIDAVGCIKGQAQATPADVFATFAITGGTFFNSNPAETVGLPAGYAAKGTGDEGNQAPWTVGKSAGDLTSLNAALVDGETTVFVDAASDAYDTDVVFPKVAEDKDVTIEITGAVAPQTEGDYSGQRVIFFKNAEHADGNEGPATLEISAPAGTVLVFDTPQSHVTINGESYDLISGRFDVNTLVIPAGVTVKKIVMEQGSVSILDGSKVAAVEIKGAEPVYFKECHNLNATVYATAKDRVAPGYAADDATRSILKTAATIGTKSYATLAAAVAAVPADGTATTIKLASDVELAKAVTTALGQNIVLDLNGHSISSTVTAISNKGNLEVTGTGTITVSGTSKTAYGISNSGGAALANRANLVVGENVTITAPCTAVYTSYAYTTVKGTLANTQAETSSNLYSTLRQSNSSEVVVTATAKVSGKVNAIYGNYGTIEVNSTDITGKIYADGSATQGLKIKKTTTVEGLDIVGHAEFSDVAEYYVAAKAISACTGTVTLLSDINGALALSAGKTVTLDLNGHKVAAESYPIKVEGNLTITGEGTVQSTGMGSSTSVQAAVYALNNGVVTIESGNYVAEYVGAEGNPAVYVRDNAKVYIEGGDFVGSSKFLLNKLDSSRETSVIEVTGGTFRNNFNPADNAAEGEHTNFVKTGYAATETPVGSGIWVVAVDDTQAAGITTQEDFVDAVKNAESGATITLGEGEFNLNAIKVTGGKALTFVGAGMDKTTLKYGSAYKQGYSDGGGVACYSFDGSGAITIKNVKVEDYYPNDGNDYDHGFVRAGKLTFENCEIASPAGCWGNNTEAVDHLVTFKSCKFTAVSTSMYSVVTYQGYKYIFDSCTFAGNAKGAMKLYRTQDKEVLYPVTIKNCKFIKGSNTTKTPIYFYDSTSNGGVYSISIEGTNTQEGYSNHVTSGTWIWGDMKNDSSKSTIKVNGTLVWANGSKQ